MEESGGKSDVGGGAEGSGSKPDLQLTCCWLVL